MVIWTSLVSFAVVAFFFVWARLLPEDTASSEFGGLAFIALPFFALGSMLSLIALVMWIRRIAKRTYSRWFHYLAILPSVPMFITWIYVGIGIILYRMGSS